jgi:N utilization substance protein A
VFAANSLSPAKVNQVRITDIENRQMEVIVNEDQLSLAIGKRGQNVRLATKLVGWNIDIRSEEELKKEVAEQMGAMIASGAPVPLAAIQVVTTQQAETLGEHGVTDIDGLVNTNVDDLVEFLDVSLDEAEKILSAARSVIEVRERAKQSATPEGDESEAAMTAGEGEADATSGETEVEVAATDAETSPDPTAAGYDEAVERGVPFSAEQNVRAEYSADPVALTEADPMTVDELVLQDAGRDLRPDVITPAPDVTSLAVADLEARLEEEVAASGQDDARIAESAATETGSALESSSDDKAATDESLKDEKQ